MVDMIESIRKVGVTHPIIIREKKNGEYEIISGHRRKKAVEFLGIKEIPAIIRTLSDDEATILMVDSNKQREHLLPSEKAFAYRMKLEAEKRQGKRNDLTYVPVGQKLNNQTTRQRMSEQIGESSSNIQRYIRLTELIPELLQLVDNQILDDKSMKKMALRPAVEISYLSKEHQKILFDSIEMYDATPTYAQAHYMRELNNDNKLNEKEIFKVMEQEKPNQVEKFKMDYDRLYNIVPKKYKTSKQIEDFIVQCIEEHNQREKSKSKVR